MKNSIKQERSGIDRNFSRGRFYFFLENLALSPNLSPDYATARKYPERRGNP